MAPLVRIGTRRSKLALTQSGMMQRAIGRALGVADDQAIASSMEIGVHNATLAIFVAVEVLDETEISIPAAVYSLFMFAFAALWGSFISRRLKRAALV